MKKVLWIWFGVMSFLAVSYAAVNLYQKANPGSAAGSGMVNHVFDSVKVLKAGLPASGRADSIIHLAKQQLGTVYKYGSCTPGAFDCSGFVFYVFSQFGITLPRSSITMGEFGTDVSLEEAAKGDLIFFTGTAEDDPDIGHVGIVITNPGEPLQFIHSSSSAKDGGVKITPFTTSPRYKERFVRVKRVL